MRFAQLGGRSGVTRIGLGCLPLSGAYGPADPVESVRLIRHALDSGVSLLDAADFTGRGDGQRLVGDAIASRREDVVLATHARPGEAASAPKDLLRQCDAALRRLGVDHIDLCYLHLLSTDTDVPVEEWVGRLGEAVTAGKVGHLGVHGIDGDQVLRAHSTHPLSALAVDYSLWERRVEREHLPLARKLGIGVVACRPLGRGILTGRIRSPDQLDPDDLRRLDPRFSRERLLAERPALSRLEELASGMDVGAGRLALAWLLNQGEDILVIPGTRDRVHFEMNLSALEIDLPSEIAARMVDLFPAGEEPPAADGSADPAAL
jgi:aryl-alcohol dehydrogenase-like predicted oxidoreductase